MKKILVVSKRQTRKEAINEAAKETVKMSFIPGYRLVKTAQRVKDAYTNSSVETVEFASMNQYKNCLNEAWQTDVLYWEHPQKLNYLIPKKQYKNYLIREMMSEIMEFVSENMALEKFVVTLIKGKNVKGNISAKIEDVNIGTKFSGYIDTEYIYMLENVPKARKVKGVPVWLNAFPNVVSAVKRGVGSMETTEKVDAGATFGLSASDIAEASFGADKSMTFYIYFKKK